MYVGLFKISPNPVRCTVSSAVESSNEFILNTVFPFLPSPNGSFF